MEFVSSAVDSYGYEIMEDTFFELPEEMDFEINDEFRDTMSYAVDEDLNDGLYGGWNAKHPWSVNNNSSIHNSNLHLDFIGGDPDIAMMVNPNVVIPSGFQFDEEVESKPSEEIRETSLPALFTFNKSEAKESSIGVDSEVSSDKRRKSRFSLNEPTINDEFTKTGVPKNGIRILKPTVVDSSISPQPSGITSSTRLMDFSKNNVYKEGHFYPKPPFSYSCLIAMALKNSKHGCLPVAEIYNFMCNHFPYFKTAPNGWKNSVRHNLSLNKCFEKIEKPAGSTQRKGCLWALNPSNAAKLEEEVQKCSKKDVSSIKRAMEYPEHLELLEKGELKSLYDSELGLEEDDDDIDTNEDVDAEEQTVCEDDTVEEKSIVDRDHGSITILNEDETTQLPEFNIEVDNTIYEELMGSIKNDQLFTMNEFTINGLNNSTPTKKVKKYFIQVNREFGKNTLYHGKKNDPEIFDHYDINNLLRFENETRLSPNKKTPRFNRRECSNSRIKQIKFKSWN